jgi:purine-binding chemotaxis protein CheW
LASIEESADPAAPRYLVARVGTQRVAWVMTAVREIIPVRPMTRLPGAPEWVSGLLNLRGAVLTVVELSGRLGLARGPAPQVIVLEVNGRSLGVRVDVVESVALAEDARVEPVEEARTVDGLVVGMVRLADGTALLMDAEALLRSVLAAV